MHFVKMNGLGNDFVILDTLRTPIEGATLPALARRLCDRKHGIGADGLMLVTPAEGNADFRMLFYNADGTEAELCGNGVRCLARYAYSAGLSGERPRFETKAGLVEGERLSESCYRIRLTPPSLIDLSRRVTIGGRTVETDYVELGIPGLPHAVLPQIGLHNISAETLRPFARALRNAREYPRGANVDFYEQTDENELFIRTFERGVEDFTLACGTGAAASVVALTLRGRVSGVGTKVRSAGGTLTVDLTREGERITALYLAGETVVEREGEII